jgi:hypothetical protein
LLPSILSPINYSLIFLQPILWELGTITDKNENKTHAEINMENKGYCKLSF